MTAPPRPSPTRAAGSARRSGTAPPRRRSTWSGGSGNTTARSGSPSASPMTTFASVLAALARADVEFLVVGGLAVAQAGYARYTEDIDVLVEGGAANVQRLIDALSAVGGGAAAELVPADFPLEEGAVRVVEDDVVVDLFTVMSGHAYADLLPLSAPHAVGGAAVRFLGAEGLVRLKAGSLRPKDQADVAALRALLAGRDPS